MKRFTSITALAIAALALTNCSNKELDTLDQSMKVGEVPFTVIAMPEETRTTVEGMNTSWASDDAINLFHAVEETTEGTTSYIYINDGKFTISDTETGEFSGSVAESPIEGTAYDWFALYPYDALLTTINGKNGTNRYYTLGSAYNGKQTQAAVGSTAHLANLPLYGVKTASVYNGKAPFIQMSQLASVAAITITNKTSNAVNISNISLTAPEDIVGTYYFNILGDNVVYNPSGESYVSSTAKLDVTEGTIAKDAVGVFYVAIKPFTAPSGSKITLTVTTTKGDSQVKEFNLSKDYTFAANKMKTVKMDFTTEHEAVQLAAPVNVKSTINNMTATMTWNKVANASGYSWQLIDESETVVSSGTIEDNNTVTTDVTIPEKGVHYSFMIKSIGDNVDFIDSGYSDGVVLYVVPDGQTYIYTLVTDASTLAAGDILVFTNHEATYAMSATQDSNNRKGVGITPASDKSTIEITDNVELITLGGSAGAWTFLTDEGYLYAASSSKNYLRSQTTNNENGIWNISISDNQATIVAQGDNQHNWLRFNNSDSIFSCYESGKQQAIAIYRQSISASTEKTLTDLTVSDVQTTEFIEGTDFEFDGVATATFDDGTSSDVSSVVECTGYNMNTLGEQTVTVSYTYKGVTKSATYTITVVAKSLKSLAIAGTQSYTVGDTFANDFVATVTYNNNTTATVVAEYSAVDANGNAVALADIPSVAGSYTVTGSYTEGGITKTAILTITVRESQDGTWVLVTDASTLNAGDVIVFAAYNATYKFSGTTYTDNKVMGAVTNSLGTPVDVNFSSDGTTIISLPAAANQYTLGGTSSAWTIMNGDKYLTQGDKKITEGTTSHTWTISFSGNDAVVTSVSANTYKLQYNPNNGNGRFATYSSAQKAIRIYRYE